MLEFFSVFSNFIITKFINFPRESAFFFWIACYIALSAMAMQRIRASLPSWDTTKKTSKKGFDKVWEGVDKLGAPVNKLTNKIGSEAFWPTTLDKESDKAARILKSFCSTFVFCLALIYYYTQRTLCCVVHVENVC